MPDDQQHLPPDDDRLKGWKEIAQCLRSSERTVQRWESALRLPVHRAGRPGNAVVLASRRELAEWLESIDGRMALAEQADSESPTEQPPGNGVADSDLPGTPETLTERASRRRSVWRRYSWALLGLGVAGLLVGYGPFARWMGWRWAAPQKGEAPTTPAAIPTVVVRLTVAEGESSLLGIQVGGTSTVTLGDGTTYVFSAELLADQARVHVSRLEPAPPTKAPRLIQLAVVALRQGARVPLAQVPGLVAMEWVDAATLNKVWARKPR